MNSNSEEEIRRELNNMRKTLEEINQKMEPDESKSLLQESIRAILIGIFLVGPAGAVLLALFSL
ncbi:MAG: hypothetical protein EA344_13020 [Alkalicoccus sp.]|nr:MAG: hypothetical protein EA344_13020 [Alkalicoccus sp.]